VYGGGVRVPVHVFFNEASGDGRGKMSLEEEGGE
jgi:hypothetical protein